MYRLNNSTEALKSVPNVVDYTVPFVSVMVPFIKLYSINLDTVVLCFGLLLLIFHFSFTGLDFSPTSYLLISNTRV